jgi:pimeloyl-ACP methyl ester carboxylesterase
MKPTNIWKIDSFVHTSAGEVAAGQAGWGEPVVLAHGWPWSSFSWHRIIAELAKTHRVFWYDMPGYGASSKTPLQRTSLDIQGAVFAEMLAHWHLDRPSVVAHDFGGATTLRAHLLHGCDFERLFLMNVVAMRPWGSEFFAHVGRHVDAFSGLPPHIHKAIVQAYIQGALTRPLAHSDLEALISPWISDEGQTSFYRQFAQADEKYTAEVEPLFGDIRCPVKILWGRDDPWIPLKRGEALHRLIPQSTMETLKGAGHLAQLEDPDAVIRSVIGFLNS